MSELGELLREAARGNVPPPDADVTVLPQPAPRDAGVIAFTRHNVVFADVDPDWVREQLPSGDVTAPLNPPFLSALTAKLGRQVNNVDVLMLASPIGGRPPISLHETASNHPRAVRARRFRDDVRVYSCPGGVLAIGRGVAGRMEAALEVDPGHRGRGLGRKLAEAARHLVEEPVWAQVHVGNAQGVRALLGAGYTQIGAEALLTRER